MHKDEESEQITYEEALSSSNNSKWKAAIQQELEAFQTNEVWAIVDRLSNKPIVKSIWVFKIKRDAEGNLACHRVHLVAKGCSQTNGIDYFETFAPVVKHSSMRLLFALAAKHDWNTDHLDVCTIFLNGDIEEVTYMELPEGYDTKGDSNKVCKLKKSVYGLKATTSCNKKATEVLKSLWYKQTCSEPCIPNKRVIL